jgi:formate hydrogenlyase transcriptional activator
VLPVPPVVPVTAPAASPDAAATGPADLREVERQHIVATLKKTGWRIDGPQGAARLLNLHPNTLRSRIKKLGIQRSHERLS